jgi:hypothetical protein
MDHAPESPHADGREGFGVLTTNTSYLYRSSGYLDGQFAVTQWAHRRFGYLPPQALSFLLAAQAVARQLTSRSTGRIASLLEANQAAFFRAAVKHLSRTDGELVRLLDIPPERPGHPRRRCAICCSRSRTFPLQIRSRLCPCRPSRLLKSIQGVDATIRSEGIAGAAVYALALQQCLLGGVDVAVTGDAHDPRARALLDVGYRVPDSRVFAHLDAECKYPRADQPTAYVCTRLACSSPIADTAALAARIEVELRAAVKPGAGAQK